MVSFNEKGYTITVVTGSNPIEGWWNLKNQLLNVLSNLQENEEVEKYMIFDLLQELELSLEQSKNIISCNTQILNIDQSKTRKTA